MKIIVLILLLNFSLIFSQTIEFVEKIDITPENVTQAFHPKMNADGNGYIFTQANYSGLWYASIDTRQAIQLSVAPSAGYQAQFIKNGKNILYREDQFISGKRYSSLMSVDLLTSDKVMIEENVRSLKIINHPNRSESVYLKDSEMISLNSFNEFSGINNNQRFVYIEKSKIVLEENGRKKILMPIGDKNYIWPSISPDGSKLLFTCAGKGTFISDFDGQILNELGKLNHPSWSPKGDYVIGMDDKDDGVKILSSDIIVYDLVRDKRFNITISDNDIALYPSWGATKYSVLYNTLDGRTYKLSLKFN